MLSVCLVSPHPPYLGLASVKPVKSVKTVNDPFFSVCLFFLKNVVGSSMIILEMIEWSSRQCPPRRARA